MPARVPGALEVRQRPVLVPAHEGTRVVDADLLHLARQGVHPLLDERLGHRAHAAQPPVQPEAGVDAVGEQVAAHPAPGRRGVEPPQPLSALRKVALDGPVLEELGPVVEDLAQPALVDQLLGEGDRGDAAVVVPHHVRHPGRLDRGHHLAPLGHVHRQRLLAQNRFAGGGRGQRDLLVQVVRGADIDDVDVFALDQLAPVGLGRFVPPLGGELLDLALVAGARGLEHDLVLGREELADLLVRVRVGPAHEPVPDHADAQLLLSHLERLHAGRRMPETIPGACAPGYHPPPRRRKNRRPYFSAGAPKWSYTSLAILPMSTCAALSATHRWSSLPSVSTHTATGPPFV